MSFRRLSACRKPNKQQIATRMVHICKAEGLDVNEAALQQLAEGANGDIRLVLGQLQMIRLRARTLKYDQVKVCPSALVPLHTAGR